MATTTRGLPVPPPALALGAALVQRRLSPETTPSVARRGAALVLAGAGLATAMRAHRGFVSRGTTDNPVKLGRSTALVTDGPFGVTRNPMYVGLTGVLVSHALWRGSVRALLPVAAVVATLDRLQIPLEERSMAELFGADYAAYRERVPRWVGPVG